MGRLRTSTLSLDIYKQTMTQSVDIYLLENNNILYTLFTVLKASRIEQFHFSMSNIVTSCILLLAAVIASIYSILVLVIILETFGVVLLCIGLCTFNLKMLKFQMLSFEVYIKMFFWTLFIIADTAWSSIFQDMNALKWTEHALRHLVMTCAILYVVLIDGYHALNRFKVRSTVVLCCSSHTRGFASSINVIFWIRK